MTNSDGSSMTRYQFKAFQDSLLIYQSAFQRQQTIQLSGPYSGVLQWYNGTALPQLQGLTATVYSAQNAANQNTLGNFQASGQTIQNRQALTTAQIYAQWNN